MHSFSPAYAQSLKLKTGDFALAISASGQITALRDPTTGKDFLVKGQTAPLLSIERLAGTGQSQLQSAPNVTELTFPNSTIVAQVHVTQKKTHRVFHLVKVTPVDEVNALAWGPEFTCVDFSNGMISSEAPHPK